MNRGPERGLFFYFKEGEFASSFIVKKFSFSTIFINFYNRHFIVSVKYKSLELDPNLFHYLYPVLNS